MPINEKRIRILIYGGWDLISQIMLWNQLYAVVKGGESTCLRSVPGWENLTGQLKKNSLLLLVPKLVLDFFSVYCDSIYTLDSRELTFLAIYLSKFPTQKPARDGNT